MFSSLFSRTISRRGGNSNSSNNSTAMGNAPSTDDENGHDGRGGGGGRPGALSTRGLSHRIVGGGSNNNSHRTGFPHLSLPSSLPSPFRSGGSLGLSRSELDARCQPTGLYPTCEWDDKQIRRLISNGQLAARIKGSDARLTKTDRECPICFMYYSESNVSKCCNATLCTECYLQIKPQKDRHTTCPFCNNPKMVVSVQRGMDEGDVAKREEEEQRVIEATIRSRVSRLHGQEGPVPDDGGGAPGAGGGERGDSGDATSASENSSFGSSLENYNRARTLSENSNGAGSDAGFASADPNSPATPLRPAASVDSEASEIAALAMSPADRRALESEMRAQLSHETHRRMESEAEEARMRHAQEWYGSQAGSRSRVREARLAELTGLLERMSARGGGGGANNASAAGGDRDGEGRRMAAMGSDAGGMGAAAAGGRPGGNTNDLARLLRAVDSSGRGAAGSGDLADLMHVTSAFSPEDLVRSDLRRLEAADLMSRLTRASFLDDFNGNETAAATARAVEHRQERNIAMSGLMGRNGMAGAGTDDDVANRHGRGLGRASSSPFGLGSGGRGLAGNRRVVRRLAGNRGVSSTHMDTAELLMRGVSEEEQLAMAIAMSMQDSQQETGGGGGGEGQQRQLSNVAEGTEGGGEARLMDEDRGEEHESSSSSSSSSSSDSSVENLEGAPSTHGQGGNNNNNRDRHDAEGGASLDEDEEEVVFTDLAEV